MQTFAIKTKMKKVRRRSSESLGSAKGQQRSELFIELAGLGLVRRSPADFLLVTGNKNGNADRVLTSPGQSLPEKPEPEQVTTANASILHAFQAELDLRRGRP